MNDPVIHPATKKRIDAFVGRPAHGLLLTGAVGLGKAMLASYIAENVLKADLSSYPYLLIISPEDNKTIGIESIRKLEQFLKLKVALKNEINRVVIIEKAETLTLEAQNAVLKTLEEPPKGTLLILTAASEDALLPTVRSRLHIIPVNRPTKAALASYLGEGAQFEKAYAMGSGLPGLISAIISDDQHPLLLATQTARQLLNQSVHERLITIDGIAKQKALALDMVVILQHMAELALKDDTHSGKLRWQKVLEAAFKAEDALKRNAQPKLVLTDLVLNL